MIVFVCCLPPTLLGQHKTSTIEVIVIGGPQPASAKLSQPESSHGSEAVINGDTIRMTDTLDVPLSGTLMISYKGTGNLWWRYPVYFMSGDLTIRIDRQNNQLGDMQVAGPKWSEDFSNLLEGPVRKYNQQINDLRKQLKKPGVDTTSLKKQLNIAINACFGVPREYIKKYPSSPLDIIALQFMGKGDRTLQDPEMELVGLFRSLPDSIQKSEEGKAYWEKLQKLLE